MGGGFPGRGGGGVVLPERLGRGVRPASQNPYSIYGPIYDLFMTWPKIRYPIYALFQTCITISYLADRCYRHFEGLVLMAYG